MCCGWGERESVWNTEECSTGSVRTRKMLTNARRGRSADFRFVALYGFLLCLCLMIYGAAAAPAAAVPRRTAAAAAGAAASAMKSLNSPLRTSHLSRLKRDAEVSFGNSQNEPREKKSADQGTGAQSTANSAVAKQEPAEADRSGFVAEAAETKPPQSFAGDAPAAAAKPDPAAGTNSVPASEASAAKTAGSTPEAGSVPAAVRADSHSAAEASAAVEKDDDKALDTDDDFGVSHLSDSSEDLSQKALEGQGQDMDPELSGKNNVDGNDLVEDLLENNEVPHGTDDDVTDDVITENLSDAEDSSSKVNDEQAYSSKENDGSAPDSADAVSQESDERNKQSNDSEKDKKNTEQANNNSRLKKRSAPSMVAESMGKEIISPERHRRSSSRTKRDLGYDELKEILDGRQTYPRYGEDEDYPLQLYTIPEENESDYDLGESRLAESSWLEQPGETLSGDAFLLPTKREEAIQKEVVRYEVLQRLLKEKEQEKAKEAVLEYLIAAAEDRLKDAIEEEREAEIDERLERMGLNPDALLEKESSNEYKVNKRYPYSYEPYGGPWGAVVPGVKRSGRNFYKPVEEDGGYERLYRLAEALGDN